jgi:hypothetical protein
MTSLSTFCPVASRGQLTQPMAQANTGRLSINLVDWIRELKELQHSCARL